MTISNNHTVLEDVERRNINDRKITNNVILSWCGKHWRNILAEFISTTMLTLFGCMSSIPITGQESSVYTPLGFGMVVMFNVQIFGHLSGAYMNPAVTLATVIWGTTSIPVAIAYVCVQCLGAIAGYGILDAVTVMDISVSGVCVTQPYFGQNPIQTLGIEIALTVALILINCALWDPVNKDKQDSAAIKFGLTILGLSIVGGPLTGASMNPARSLGPAIWTAVWTDHWVYWVGPLLGSIIGAVLYKFIYLQNPLSSKNDLLRD